MRRPFQKQSLSVLQKDCSLNHTVNLEKVAWQTELETVSELFCVEDSRSNHEQKQAS